METVPIRIQILDWTAESADKKANDIIKQIQKICNPSDSERASFEKLARDGPLVASHQVYFVNDLDPPEKMRQEMEDFVDVCHQHIFNMRNIDIQKSSEDWFHALFFNFDMCEMTQELESAVDFVLRKYEPIAEIPQSQMQWDTIRRVFHMVIHHKSPSIKTFVLLALITWEKELQDKIRSLFTTEEARANYAFCLPHLKQLVDGFVLAPYQRSNINYIIEFFLVKACKLCQMNVLPNMEFLLAEHFRFVQALALPDQPQSQNSFDPMAGNNNNNNTNVFEAEDGSFQFNV